MKRQRGFTLVELMVVVAIIAILAAILVSVSTRPIGANSRNTSEEIVGSMNFAKLRANATRRIHRFTVTQTDFSIWAASTTGLVIDPGAEITTWDHIRTTRLRGGVKIIDAQNAPIITVGTATVTASLGSPTPAYNIDFRPDGQATATTLFITDTNKEYRVIVYPITGGAYARAAW